MSDFPLTIKLGLAVRGRLTHDKPYVFAEELEKILAAAPIYYYSELNMTDDTLTLKRWGSDTHQARAILMEPIPKTDTAESLLKELFSPKGDGNYMDRDWVSRARRVVGNPE